jgi:formate-dependent nitrite reductase membrane component NrfD
MNSYKTGLILALTGYGLLAGAAVACILHYFFPGFNWNWFIAVFVFFLALESLIINLAVKNSQKKDSKKLVNVYMLTKGLKIILSLAFVLIYFIIERTNGLKTFAITLIGFYLLFLIAETYLLTRIEKHIKKESNNE